MGEELLFYDAYQKFYEMAEQSVAFKTFCKEAFGEDFSQDGFSDINQVNMILQYIPEDKKACILDVGCGNGKMLRYLQSKTGCSICGFDYSENAIKSAKSYSDERAEYRVGIIGEIEYPENSFDVIISMDSIYFAKDMDAFVRQIKGWLKKDGILFVAYQEGDVMPKTENEHTTVLARALRNNNLKYDVTDITKDTYDMLRKKRQSAIKYKADFLQEGGKEWWDLLMWQTECVTDEYEVFAKKMARYVYIVK